MAQLMLLPVNTYQNPRERRPAGVCAIRGDTRGQVIDTRDARESRQRVERFIQRCEANSLAG